MCSGLYLVYACRRSERLRDGALMWYREVGGGGIVKKCYKFSVVKSWLVAGKQKKEKKGVGMLYQTITMA